MPTIQESFCSEIHKFCSDVQLCFGCLGIEHSQRECRYKKKCNIDGSQRTHHKLLNEDRLQSSSTEGGETVPQITQARMHHVNHRRRKIRLGVIRLKFIYGRKTSFVNIMTDEGSDTTLIR